VSTRSTTHFLDYSDVPEAIIYRHADGYPSGAGADLLRFFDEVSELDDTRFSDASYLAAKYVVFLAREFSVDYDWSATPAKITPKASRLDFLSVGVVRTDPGDIEYRYVVDCRETINGRPKTTVIETHGTNYGGDKVLGELAEVVARDASELATP